MNADKFYGLGHKKEAIAKVYMVRGKGVATLRTGNKENRRERDFQTYFCNSFLVEDIFYPLTLTNNRDKFDLSLHVVGGGLGAQAAAAKLAIAKALLESNPAIKPTLKTYKLLTQDRRFKERKKIGKRGARRSPQFTKR